MSVLYTENCGRIVNRTLIVKGSNNQRESKLKSSRKEKFNIPTVIVIIKIV